MVLISGTSRLMASKVSGVISNPICLASAGICSKLLVEPPVASYSGLHSPDSSGSQNHLGVSLLSQLHYFSGCFSCHLMPFLTLASYRRISMWGKSQDLCHGTHSIGSSHKRTCSRSWTCMANNSLYSSLLMSPST